MVAEDDMLPLSGIQHYLFCPRQWALIHIDQQWEDNQLTTEGNLLHENVDNPSYRQKNGDGIITLRGLRISSDTLGLSGIADAVEIRPLHTDQNLSDILKSKCFTALPIEYKRGVRKINDGDRAQVAAQAMMLEEMFGISIQQGAVFYWQERHREYFEIDVPLRALVRNISEDMNEIFLTQKLPPAIPQRHCRSCSLVNICMPGLKTRGVSDYISRMIAEDL